MAFPVTLNGRTYTLTDFEGTNYVDGLPDAFEDFVTHAGDIYNSTSTTSNSIGTGSKTFTVEANKPYQAGTPLRIADAAAPSTNFLDTVVTSYSGTTLVVNSIGYGGSGTKTSWTVNIGGAKTVDGTLGLSQGGTGATDAAGARTNIDVYSKSEADTRYLNISGDTDDISFTGSLTINDDLLHLQATNATTGNAIVRIEGGTAGYSQIHFADADDINEGRITFDHATNEMQFFNEVQNMTLTTGGDLLVGAMGTTTITGLSAGNHLLVGSGTGSEIVAYRNDNGIADDDFVGAFLFGNDDNSVTEDHFSGIWAKANGTAGSMDVFFAAGKTGYETDTPHMTLDASGNLIVGGTSPGEDGAITLSTTGYIQARIDNDTVAYFDRTGAGDDGEVIRIQQNGATVGSIGAKSDDLYINTGDTGLRFNDGNDQIWPVSSSGTNRDAAIDLGNSGVRFKNVFLSEGVYLGGTGAANKLSSYEEGTWTPSVGGATTDPTVTYGTQQGFYVKIGRMVHISMYLNCTAVSGGAGAAKINGIPFNANNAGSYFGGSQMEIFGLNVPSNMNNVVLRINGNSGHFRLEFVNTQASSTGGSADGVATGDLANNFRVLGSFTYMTT